MIGQFKNLPTRAQAIPCHDSMFWNTDDATFERWKEAFLENQTIFALRIRASVEPIGSADFSV
jgi:hypothetical protein